MDSNFNSSLNSFDVEMEQRAFMTKVYSWMFIGLMITALVAYMTGMREGLVEVIFGNRLVFFGLIILELILVGSLSGWVQKMSADMATALFITYSAINGLTLSIIFLVYSLNSIYITFLITAGVFGIMSMYGYVTKTDLTSWGNILFMGLIGLILATLVNFFLGSEMVYWLTTYIGIIIFTGLTAYDTQKIKEFNIIGNEGTDEDRKEAIIGALALYLDFINLFLYILRILGRRK